MINSFIDSVLIIDDKRDEVEGLITIFNELDIWTTHYSPPKEKSEIEKLSQLRNRKLIFLDLRLDESQKTKYNIQAVIRPLFERIIGKEFGSYGIVMWTNNPDHIDEFKEKIAKDDDKYDLPLFIVGLNKMKYIRDGYEELLEDLQRELEGSTAANFFINWSMTVSLAKNKTIGDIYRLINSYELQDKNLEFILYQMAKNYIGIDEQDVPSYNNLYEDLFISFSELLLDNSKHFVPECNLFKKNIEYIIKDDEIELRKKGNEYLQNGRAIGKRDSKRDTIDKEITRIFAEINSKLLLEFNDTGIFSPGSVFINNDSCLWSNKMNKNDIPIIIELTPPCDFANKSKYAIPKFISGFITDYNNIKNYKSDATYTESYPLSLSNSPISGFEGIYALVFDFRYVNNIPEAKMKADGNYFLFKVKDKLFADILQKFASYSARLGLSIIR